MIRPVGNRVARSIIGVLSSAIVGVVGVLLLTHDPGRRGSAAVTALPALNAMCAALLIVGCMAIRRRRIGVHRAFMLAAHVALAAVMVPFVLTTVYRVLSGRFDRHVPIARRTPPVWLDVSVTGVLVYLLLYRVG
jgi:uncharacterized membrane protein YozB (DUF420 family)